MCRRLHRDIELYSKYLEAIQDYRNQGIVEKVDVSEISKDKPIYYLPGKVVKKEGRLTTSTHIVFDAASHQANGLSLNDCLWPCPNLYPNLPDVLTNFSCAISSNVLQTFLQICLEDKRRIVIRFLFAHNDSHVEKKANS